MSLVLMVGPALSGLSMSDELLSRLISEGLKIMVTPSEQVEALRAEVRDLQKQLQDLRTAYNRCEYLYRCECIINNRLHDFCREQGVRVPNHLFHNFDSAG